MTRLFTLLIRGRFFVLAALAAITVFFVAQYPRARLETDLAEMFLDDPTVVNRYKQTIREFGSDEIILVAFDSEGLFTADGLGRLEAAIADLEQIDEIERALAVVTADRIEGTETELRIRPYVDDLEDTEAWMAALRSELAGHELYRDLLISRDGRTAAVLLELTVDDDRSGEAMPGLCRRIDETLEAHGIGPKGRHMLGFPVNVAETILESQRNLVRTLPIALVSVFLVGWFLFRALWPTLLTLCVSTLAVVWVLGFAILVSPEISILATIVPVVILVLGFADVIHLTNTYIVIVTDGVPREEAVLRTVTEVGPACLFTSLTTLLGFGSFVTVPVVAMRSFAVIMAFGTAAALFIAVTLVPVLFTLFPAPQPRRSGLSAAHGSPLDRALRRCDFFAQRYPGVIAAVALAITIAALWTTSQLHVEVDFVQRFRVGHPVRVATEFVQARMAGANTAEIVIETPERDGVFDPDFLHAVQEMQRQVLALPSVDSAQSLVDLLVVIHREMNAGAVAPDALPDTRELAAQYVLLFSFDGEDDLGRMVNFDRNRLRMAVRLNKSGMQDTNNATAAILAIADRTLPPGTSAAATGLMVLFGEFLQFLIRYMLTGMLTAILTITAVLVIAFGSVRIALGAMIVNYLPLLIFLGTIHWFDAHFDTDYIVVACVALGIAVDDTIHFLNRCRLELRHTGGDVDEAIHRTFDHTGKPIVQTTLIIVVGFGAFNFCSYTMARAFGAMLGCTLIWAMLADLLLLPVLIRAGIVPLKATAAAAEPV